MNNMNIFRVVNVSATKSKRNTTSEGDEYHTMDIQITDNRGENFMLTLFSKNPLTLEQEK